jgi:hypothetical protein
MTDTETSSEENSPRDNLVRLTTGKLKERAAAGEAEGKEGTAEDAKKACAKIVKCHSAWKSAKAARAQVAKDCKERRQSEESAFKEAIEAPLKANASRNVIYSKLTNVETRWQELSEVKSQNIEETKASTAEVKATAEALDRAIQEAAQLALPFPLDSE